MSNPNPKQDRDLSPLEWLKQNASLSARSPRPNPLQAQPLNLSPQQPNLNQQVNPQPVRPSPAKLRQ